MGESVMCQSCGVDMVFAVKAPLRIGGTAGGWKLILGEWAELGEDMLPLDIWVCSNCGRITFFADQETKQRLLRSSKM